ncbi:MAG: ATP-binding protein [Leptothrix sp. (in: b-proteobacteria)]
MATDTPIVAATSFCRSLRPLRQAYRCSPIVDGGGCRGHTFAFRTTFTNGKKATRPCPCGHLGDRSRACRCSPEAVTRYQARLSGPLLDRIDLRVEVLSVSPQELAAAPDGEASHQIAERVLRARERQLARQGCANAMLNGAALDSHCACATNATQFLQAAAGRLGWSSRSFHRVLRIARTVADLAGSASIEISHIAEAIQLRRALPGA